MSAIKELLLSAGVDDVIAFGALAVAGFSWWSARRAANAAELSATVAQSQLDVLTKKVTMIDEPGKMSEVLPAWFVNRMANDYWYFGLLMDNNVVLPIHRIQKISDDGRWLEVELMEQGDDIHEFPDSPIKEMPVIYALEGRTPANVQISKIVGTIELANT
ncbi:hypothetical protein SAMN04488045_1623 [Thalassococcus halodurans]|uniref:Uncharacterized protein n=1 Tax=Thalassococcus halodurans TaxID=373675 RepID=A0A1H5WX62_9RHOB|nr:hypothetical protein [Thalassococcus halodurans]SEG03893.1 hypothetical protein SAMN04488045_1623 [Thalassococcus halodurans]